MKLLVIIFISAEMLIKLCNCEYNVTLSHNGPVVLGAEISFKVEVLNSDGERPNDSFKFLWTDDAIPRHEENVVSDNAESCWNVSYPSEKYAPGQYEVQVDVKKWVYAFYLNVASQRIKFNVTAKLNGKVKISQGGISRKDSNIVAVSNIEEVTHEVVLSPPDKEYLSSATQVLSYWYVDCVYYGLSEGYTFLFNFTQEGQVRMVEVLVVASFEPLPTPEPSTTTTTQAPPNTTTQSPGDNNSTTELTSTSTTPSTTSEVSNFRFNATEAVPMVLSKVDGIGNLNVKLNLAQGPSEPVPNICMNKSIIPPDPKKIYGYFGQQLKVNAPVTNVTVNGTSWLQRGDIIYLHINCLGSNPFTYCVRIMPGLYNATGNETCQQGEMVTGSFCEIDFQRYLSVATTYTALIIISNAVSNKVQPVAINIYEVTQKAQLSVIVVPVVCTILAVILMIFGVAYYVQNRRRFVVEVADFHFGHIDVDMECKTFQERLRDAIVNAFSRSIIEDDSDSEGCDDDNRTGRGMWPPRGFGNTAGPSTSGVSGVAGNVGSRGDARGQKYGSME